MGQFSWICVKSLKTYFEDEFKPVNIAIGEGVYLLIPKELGGGYLYEKEYEGYGMIGGRDVYGLLAEWNRAERYVSDSASRFLGIDIGCFDEQQAKLDYKLRMIREDVFDSESDTYELYDGLISLNDPNQGWSRPDEEDSIFIKEQAKKCFGKTTLKHRINRLKYVMERMPEGKWTSYLNWVYSGDGPFGDGGVGTYFMQCDTEDQAYGLCEIWNMLPMLLEEVKERCVNG